MYIPMLQKTDTIFFPSYFEPPQLYPEGAIAFGEGPTEHCRRQLSWPQYDRSYGSDQHGYRQTHRFYRVYSSDFLKLSNVKQIVKFGQQVGVTCRNSAFC